MIGVAVHNAALEISEKRVAVLLELLELSKGRRVDEAQFPVRVVRPLRRQMKRRSALVARHEPVRDGFLRGVAAPFEEIGREVARGARADSFLAPPSRGACLGLTRVVERSSGLGIRW